MIGPCPLPDVCCVFLDVESININSPSSIQVASVLLASASGITLRDPETTNCIGEGMRIW